MMYKYVDDCVLENKYGGRRLSYQFDPGNHVKPANLLSDGRVIYNSKWQIIIFKILIGT